MIAHAVQMTLLWVAVFVGLDVAFGEGVLTGIIEDALERAATCARQLLRSIF